MAAKGKIARGALDALTDAYKRTFDPETYYHYSESPDIKTFDPKAKDSFGGYNFSRGATYFTKDKDFINEFFDEKLNFDYEDVIEENQSAKNLPYGKLREKFLEDYSTFSRNPENVVSEGFYPTVYPVKIKTDKIFDHKNEAQVKDLLGPRRPSEMEDKIYDEILFGSYDFLERPEIQKMIKEKGYSGYTTNEPGTIALFNPDKGDVRSIFAKFDPAKSESGEILASVPAAALVTGGALSGLVDE